MDCTYADARNNHMSKERPGYVASKTPAAHVVFYIYLNSRNRTLLV